MNLVDIWRRLCGWFKCYVCADGGTSSHADHDYVVRVGYNGSAVVERSIEISEPTIFVAVNYR